MLHTEILPFFFPSRGAARIQVQIRKQDPQTRSCHHRAANTGLQRACIIRYWCKCKLEWMTSSCVGSGIIIAGGKCRCTCGIRFFMYFCTSKTDSLKGRWVGIPCGQNVTISHHSLAECDWWKILERLWIVYSVRLMPNHGLDRVTENWKLKTGEWVRVFSKFWPVWILHTKELFPSFARPPGASTNSLAELHYLGDSAVASQNPNAKTYSYSFPTHASVSHHMFWGNLSPTSFW